MSPRKPHHQALYLEPERATLLNELSEETRVPKAILLREAADDLLIKNKKMKEVKPRTNK
jgi:hypothetical protein